MNKPILIWAAASLAALFWGKTLCYIGETQLKQKGCMQDQIFFKDFLINLMVACVPDAQAAKAFSCPSVSPNIGAARSAIGQNFLRRGNFLNLFKTKFLG